MIYPEPIYDRLTSNISFSFNLFQISFKEEGLSFYSGSTGFRNNKRRAATRADKNKRAK
jgi:hypothetical protein